MDVSRYSEDQLDCLQEICNVAMGRAGDALARQYGVFVKLSVPVVKFLRAAEFATSLNNYQADDHVYAAGQLFESEHPDLEGLGMVMMSDVAFGDLMDLVNQPISEEELITGSCLVLSQTCLNALSEDWGLGFQVQSPQQIANNCVGEVCNSLTADWEHVLMVEINYGIEGRKYQGELLLLFPNQSIDVMAERLDELLV